MPRYERQGDGDIWRVSDDGYSSVSLKAMHLCLGFPQPEIRLKCIIQTKGYSRGLAGKELRRYVAGKLGQFRDKGKVFV